MNFLQNSSIDLYEHQESKLYTWFIMIHEFIVHLQKDLSLLHLPHGSTMTPDLALPLPNIFLRDFSWYGLSTADGFKSMLQS